MNGKEKTTREILNEKFSGRKRVPLYNQEALTAIRRKFEEWMTSSVRENDQKNWMKTPRTVLGSDIPRKMLYTPLSNPDFDYQTDLGNSGQEPFARGIHANMYRGKEFTTRQLTGFGSPEDTNERIKFMLDHGATGLNIKSISSTESTQTPDIPTCPADKGSSESYI